MKSAGEKKGLPLCPLPFNHLLGIGIAGLGVLHAVLDGEARVLELRTEGEAAIVFFLEDRRGRKEAGGAGGGRMQTLIT